VPPCTATFPMVCRSLRDSRCSPAPATIQRFDNNGQPQGSHSRRMKTDGHTGKDIAKHVGVSRATLYRYLAVEGVA
jgi:hypothetical protein